MYFEAKTLQLRGGEGLQMDLDTDYYSNHNQKSTEITTMSCRLQLDKDKII